MRKMILIVSLAMAIAFIAGLSIGGASARREILSMVLSGKTINFDGTLISFQNPEKTVHEVIPNKVWSKDKNHNSEGCCACHI